MEQVFSDLQKDGKNDVDALVKWIQDAHLVEKTSEAEDELRALFNDVAEESKVEFDKFKDVINKLAENTQNSFEELSRKLGDEGPRFLDALAAGYKAFRDTLAAGSNK